MRKETTFCNQSSIITFLFGVQSYFEKQEVKAEKYSALQKYANLSSPKQYIIDTPLHMILIFFKKNLILLNMFNVRSIQINHLKSDISGFFALPNLVMLVSSLYYFQ